MTAIASMRATVPLPWTKPELSLNDRGASKGAAYAKAGKAKTIRDTTALLARQYGLPRGVGHATVELHYRPKDNRRRDTDNLVATAKPIFDGLVDYGLVPDDIPRHMAKLEPVIHRGQAKTSEPRLWLVITTTAEPKEPPA